MAILLKNNLAIGSHNFDNAWNIEFMACSNPLGDRMLYQFAMEMALIMVQLLLISLI